MNVNARMPQHWWEQFRWARHGFFLGLILGIAMGWFFHGLISFFFRFGLVLLLLLPLLVIGWFWLRSTRGGQSDDPAGNERQVVTWSSRSAPPPESDGPFVDVPVRPARRVAADQPPARAGRPGSEPTIVPADIERELQELKRQQEQAR